MQSNENMQNNTCFNCFSQTGGYDVCPYCGHVAGTPNAPAFMLQPGMRIWGRYLIGTILGIGGFGVTYKAFDTRLQSVVAIKEFFPQNLASRMPGEIELRLFTGETFKNFEIHKQRFIEEGKNLAKFTGDAHIVNVLDSFEDNRTAYIIMEYLDGCTLKEYMAQCGGSIEFNRASEIMKDLLEGLKSIHLKGIIHRDISPDNIHILSSGNVKVLDFGAARFAAKEEWTQSVVVKKGYAPPEQYRNNMRQTPQTDLYAAGATFYKMLTGKTPEESIERTEKDTLQRPSKLKEGIDAQTDKFIMKAVALKPELRFKDANAMMLALSGATGFDYPEEELKKIKRRQRGIVAIAVLMVCSVLGLMGYRIANGQSAVPQIITLGETLADKNIEPDTITLWVDEYENQTGAYTELVNEFMQEYPEHEIILEVLDWEIINQVGEGTLEVEPDIFAGYMSEAADLTPLINGLDPDDYYFFDYYENRIANDRPIINMDMTFSTEHIVVSADIKNNEDIFVPKAITSIDELLQFTNQFYDDNYGYGDTRDDLEMATFFLPELIKYNGDTDLYEYKPETWEDFIRTYVQNSLHKSIAVGVDEGYIHNEQYTPKREYYNYYYNKDRSHNFNSNNMHTEIAAQSENGAMVIPLAKEVDGQTVILANTSHYLTVNSASSENKQYVAMLFMHFMLSEKGQNILCVQHALDLPINKAAMQQKIEYAPELESLLPYLNGDYEDNTYDIYRLGDAFAESMQDYTQIDYYDDDLNIESLNQAQMDSLVEDIADDAVDYLLNYDFVDEDW